MSSPATANTPPEGPSAGHVSPQTAILAIILLSYFMVLLDNSVIFTALPSLQSDLDLTRGELSWVQDIYTLVFGGFLLLGARAGDLLGRRRVFIAGLAIFTLASFLIGIAPAGWWIIASRALQGIGAAIVAPATLSLLTSSFAEGNERSRAISWYGATAGIGASLGLVLGGALTSWISWRAGFFVNVPIGIAMIALAPKYLPESERQRGKFDLPGALLATFGVGAVVFGVIESVEQGWTSLTTLSSLAVGVILLAALVFNERRAAQPIMPLRLFASRERTGAYIVRLLFLGAMIGFFYFSSQFMQGVLGFTPLQAGAGFLPMTIVNFAVALSTPAITRRFCTTLPIVVGIAIACAGVFWLSHVHVNSNYLTDLALPMLLIGAGQGLAFAPLTSAGIAGVAVEDAGAASGLVNTFHQVGMSLGLAVVVAVATPVAASEYDDAARLALESSVALSTGSLFMVLSLVVAFVLIVPAAVSSRRKLSEK
ncbi:MFS transporter [Neomicrococcus aestuarii]|uniref:MFS transporter n=1 Tax=Neomicrococcus aestuarii TaxID=556325 RepID=A0A1L2ZMC1_9MICC|nr:MFS transporter [Neomicrococcus aestuarii]APF40534.1 MFS transporter [Neomicrococcus aestuarii]